MRDWQSANLLLGAVIAITALAISIDHAAAVEDASSLVHRSEIEVRGPQTDGKYAVWADRVSANRWDVLGADLTSGAVFPIATGGDASRSDPAIDGGIVVWSEGSDSCPNCERDILGMDLQSGERFSIATGVADQTRPAISGGNVVWVEDRGNELPSLRGVNLDQPDKVSTLSEQHSIDTHPKIDGDRAVWVEQRGMYTEREDRLVTAKIGDNDITIIEDFDGHYRGGHGNAFEVAGNRIYFLADPLSLLHEANLDTGETRTLSEQQFLVGGISMGDRYIIGHIGPTLRRGPRLRIWDTQTGSTFVTPSDVSEAMADIHDGTVVWQRGSGWREIHSRPISQLLPTTPQPPPAQLGTETQYHETTGLTLGGRFLTFWQESGGLPVFGHPMSTEFLELNPDSGRMHTVQYFERQRYEFHADLIGTPYEVQLGRLGFAEAERRGLLNHDAFQPETESLSGVDRCEAFEVTGFVVCDQFLDYWESHGLNLGDEGISYRESLALFGYPISQPYFDQETGLLTQYFERARFEFHPDNPEEHVVLLGRLGADLIEERDW